MFPVDQLSRFEVHNPTYRLLKPWWDVFTDYLAAALLVIAVLSGAIEATRSNLFCLPAVDCNFNELNHSMPNPETNSFCRTHNHSTTMRSRMTVLVKLQDRRQYDFVEAECGQKAVHPFASYFPLIIFIQALILIVVDNFWLKFPQTSSIVEHFVTLVTECYNTPGTCLAVSNALWGTNISEDNQSKAKVTKESPKDIEQGSHDSRQPLLRGTSQTNGSLPTQLIETKMSASLDVSEAIKAKTLYEKMRQFRSDVEGRKKRFSLRCIYLGQAAIQVGLSMLFLILNLCFYSELKKTVKCEIDDIISGDYNYFKCSNVLAPYFQVAFVIFYVLIWPYLCCVVICVCNVFRMKNGYDFQKIHKRTPQPQNTEDNRANESSRRAEEARILNYTLLLSDIPEASGDLAFMLHLLDEYNKLFSLRFATFLSKKSESKLKDFILRKEWPIEKLKMVAEDGGRTLKLTNLSGIPKTVFEMDDLDSLILENCTLTDDDFDREDWLKLRGLRSLSLIRCCLTSIPAAILEVSSLETLNLSHNSIKSIPEEITYLHDLLSLNIARNNITEGMKHIIPLNLRELNLRENDTLQLSVPLCQPTLMRLYVNEAMVENMSDETRQALADIIVKDEICVVIKYLPDRAPHIEKARKDGQKVYKMTSKPKGLALIINIQQYHGSLHLYERSGSERDAVKLHKLFQEIGYKVKNISQGNVSTVRMFKNELSTLINDNVTYDSIILAVMAHGIEEGMYLESEELISVEQIVEILQTDSLEGKPKMVFIQTCRGSRTDHGLRRGPVVLDVKESLPAGVETLKAKSDNNTTDALSQGVSESATLDVSLPRYADVLIAYSTLQGFVSWRNTQHGSWFIHSLVEVFSKYAWEEDLLSLLTFVNYEVSRKLSFRGYKQVPAPQSTLTKKLYFLPGYFEDE